MPHPDFDAKAFLASVSTRPGVYIMHDVNDTVLYVGKAKNLKNRLASYFRARGLNNKTVALVSKIHHIQVTITHSETEALLLEQTLIKKYRPPYNILLIDGKSYPYLYLSTEHRAPGIFLHRGSRKKRGRYFGPFPNAYAVRESLTVIQRAFQLRDCEDTVFEQRRRPCMQYQIKRCTAPCVNKISDSDYRDTVNDAIDFLEGRNQALFARLEDKMQAKVSELKFEDAATIRDQVLFLRKVQEDQNVAGKQGEADVFALEFQSHGACLHWLMVRKGRVVGSRSFFPKVGLHEDKAELFGQFIGQFYLAAERPDLPDEIITASEVADASEIEDAIYQLHQKRISIRHSVRKERARWQDLAQTNAQEQLAMHLAKKETMSGRFVELQKALKLEALPQRLECFDISHTMGEETKASCVVFTPEGPDKRQYRTMNITGITGGDDYAAMAQAIERRIKRLQKEDKPLPDLLIVDGGKGQMNQTIAQLEALGVRNKLRLLAVAKGVTRKPGFETLYLDSPSVEIMLPGHSPALHLIQHIRDESHRFAITGHRKARDQKRSQSLLEQIPGVGPARRKAIIRHFGSVHGLKGASLREIERVEGVSTKLAEQIYQYINSH